VQPHINGASPALLKYQDYETVRNGQRFGFEHRAHAVRPSPGDGASLSGHVGLAPPSKKSRKAEAMISRLPQTKTLARAPCLMSLKIVARDSPEIATASETRYVIAVSADGGTRIGGLTLATWVPDARHGFGETDFPPISYGEI
jgi:hypothetical protein